MTGLMDKFHGDQSKATFGPEWLTKDQQPLAAHFSDEDRPSAGKTSRHPLGKKIPLRYTRSKSTPLLPVEEGEEEPEEKRDGAFTLVKERNSFDRNFPTLGHPQTRGTGLPKASAWKTTSQNKLGSIAAGAGSSPPTGPPEPSMELASCLVPTVQPPKVLTRNRVELKKGGPPKKKFDTSVLRKATSDPNLPIPPAYQENYAKLMAKKAEEKKSKDKGKGHSVVVLNKSDFFKGLKDQEKNPTPTRPPDDPHTLHSPTMERAPEPKLLSLEDEERFLRNLGWVPEEEAHVPELTEEEIREEALKLKAWMQQHLAQKKRSLSLGLDVSIKKWQDDRERASMQFATKIY